MLLTYAAIVFLSYLAIQGPWELGLELGDCGNDVCVAWVTPAGEAWHDGARLGMRVATVNGGDPHRAPSARPLTEAELVSPDGKTFVVRVLGRPFALRGAEISIWSIGAMFVLLGALVFLRRPDAAVTRLFGLFTGLTAFALGVSPAAGGPHPPWVLIVQFLSLLMLATSLPAFATVFVDGWRRPLPAPLKWYWLAAGALWIGFLACLVIQPDFYDVIRPAFFLYFLASIVSALFILARKARGGRSQPAVRDARLALYGIAFGTLPFVGLTVIPLAILDRELVPAQITAIFWSIIPVTFAYAILRHQVLGIRRLVHRGMVYGATSLILLGVISLLIVGADAFVGGGLGSSHPALVTAVLLCLGAALFHPVRRAAQSLLERFLYHYEVDSSALLAGVRSDLLGSDCAEEVVAAMVKRLRDSLRLEAIILFLGTTADTIRVAAADGTRSQDSLAFVRPRLLGLDFDDNGVAEARLSSDVLLIARLVSGSDTVGFLVLGPKEEGEVFLREERRLVEMVTPILALALRETALLAELREVSEKLTSTEEAERARLARDLHDGPLQKAILLGGAADASIRDRNGVARELATELRELCARLRPAILDDLGLVPALEWLLEQTAQGFMVTPTLTLRGMTEYDRLTPNTELALFRVTQEAVNNALKHGHPSSIHVSLAKTVTGVHLSIADDGKGLASPSALTHGMGVPGMRERLRQVGGRVAVAPNGRAGTMVTAHIPLPPLGEQ